MRWIHALVITTLLAASGSSSANLSKGIISCSNSSLDSLPDNWTIEDQTCVRIDLGVHEPGTTLLFDINTDSAVDILLFPSNTVAIYQEEQSYRSDSVWISESVFESFIGSGEWHWETPSDRGSTRWYLVIDNIAHPQDSGEGSQGGQAAEVDLEGGVIQPELFTLSDSIHRVDPGQFAIVHGPFSIDKGTFLEIHARTMEGAPDIFVMSETAFFYYSPNTNWSSSLRTISADMLLVTNERYLPWEADNLDGEDLYIVVDNRPGPGGGGAGNSVASITVTVTLTPILDPTISSASDLESVDVGSTVILSALETPNSSDQIRESGYSWDINEDGITDSTGPTIEYTWEAPGNYSVGLTATSVDSRSESNTIIVRVTDNSDPSVSMGVTGEITKGFGEQLIISGTFSDNWGVQSLDWMIDGEVIWSNYSLTEPSTTLILDVTSEYSPGTHVISLMVVDKSGRSTKKDIEITFIDVTPPYISQYESTLEVRSGDPLILQVAAQDNESEELEFVWSINEGTENEVTFFGPQVIYEFSETGPQNVICRIENDAGLTSFAEILVIVEEPESEGDSNFFTIVIVSLVLFSALSAVGIYGFNTFVLRKMDEISTPEDENEHSPPEPPSAESQIQMWGVKRPESFQAPAEPPSQNTLGQDVMDLLGVSEEIDNVMTNSPHSELLEDLEDVPKEIPGNDAPRKVRKECGNCSKPFEIIIPDGINNAYTNCPYCGSEELVSFSEDSQT